jgi:hypothetical protein
MEGARVRQQSGKVATELVDEGTEVLLSPVILASVTRLSWEGAAMLPPDILPVFILILHTTKLLRTGPSS